MRKGVPHVTITRPAWRSITTQAAGHAREAGGLLIGRQTQMGTYIISADVALAHIESTTSQVRYDHDEVHKARAAAYATYGPKLEPIGGWHTHPWPNICIAAIEPQISDDDVEEMIEGDLELIMITYPDPHHKYDRMEYKVSRSVGDVMCNGEVYLKTSPHKVVPCTIVVR